MRKAFLFLLLLTFNQVVLSQNFKTIKINNAEAVAGELLIKFKKPQGNMKASQITSARQSIMAINSATQFKKFKIGAEHWKVETGDIESIIDELKHNEYVEYVEPNYIIKANITPNDPAFDQQWGLNNTGQTGGIEDADINAAEAWEITTGDSSIVVGVLDTGIDYLHEDLVDNIWVNNAEIPDNGIDDDANGYIDDYYGWDFVNNDNDPMDDYFHGTHVAGIIGAKGDNGIGIAGVAWECKLMALKMMEEWGGTLSAAIEAIEYANVMEAKITNNSWSLTIDNPWGSSSMYSQSLFDAIQALNDKDILFVTSAGNDAHDIDVKPSYPGSYNIDNIINIGASTSSNNLAEFSNWGMYAVDLVAPGTFIYSTVLNNSYFTFDGTSMAAPMVSGGAVLLYAKYPYLNVKGIKDALMYGVKVNTDFKNQAATSGSLSLSTSLSGLSIINRLVDFGGESIGNISKQKKIILQNNINEEIVIDSITSDIVFKINTGNTPSNFINTFIIPASQSDSVFITFTPDILGEVENTIKFYYHNSEGTAYLTKATVLGKGFPEDVIVYDNDFRIAINNILGEPEDYNPTIEDLATINEIQIYDCKITDISGAEYLVNCKTISINGIRKDEDIQLYEGLSDLTPLENLEDLEQLYLNYNQKISDLTPLSGLKNLVALHLRENYICDLRSISNLENLQTLLLGNNNISDIEHISSLVNLGSLDLSYNFIIDINALAELHNLNVLQINNNQISNITPLSNLSNLAYLALSDNPLTEYNTLTNLPNLSTLELTNAGISEIDFIINIPNLQTLMLDHNNISNIEPLSSLTMMRVLLLGYNDIIDIKPLSSLSNLVFLDLGVNKINDISPLSNLVNLTYLDLHNYYINVGNNVTEITSLANLKSLTRLHLSMNPVTNISTLSELTEMKYLDLQWCLINDISPLVKLENITHLYLTINNISDIYPLVENTGVGSGDVLWMGAWYGGNPFSKEAFTEHLPILIERGFADITYPQEFINEAPCYPNPGRHEKNMDSNVTLRWKTFTDKEISYDIYVGTEPDNLLLLAENIVVDSAIYTGEPSTKYYWRVIAKVDTEIFYSGVWDFETNNTVGEGIETRIVKNISIYPNPTTGKTILEFENIKIRQIIISDLTGRAVFKKILVNKREFIDISYLENGVYLFTVKEDDKIFTRRIIKK